MTSTVPSTRPYLRPRERRRQLLDAAARVFARSGYEGLTMVALAEEAAVSRRLVYDHFPDLASLYDAFFDDQVAETLVAIDTAVAGADAPDAALSAAFACLVAMPADRQRAVRLVAAGAGGPALDSTRGRLHAHVESRWLSLVAPAALDRKQARAMLWVLVNGLLALADLGARGELPTRSAITIARKLAAAAVDGAR